MKKNIIKRVSFLSVVFVLSVALKGEESKQAKKVMTLGSVTCDIFLSLESGYLSSMNLLDKKGKSPFIMLQEGVKIDISKARKYTGGGASNTAVCFQRLGCDTSIFCKLGKDSFTQEILDEFNADGVSVENVIYDEY